MSKSMQMMAHIAIFLDLTTLNEKFETEKWVSKFKKQGRLLIKKAYAETNTYSTIKQEMEQNALELIEITQSQYGAGIKLTVDVLDTLFHKPHIDTFVLFIGEQNYVPVFFSLRAANKRVIVITDEPTLQTKWKAYCDEIYDYHTFFNQETTPIFENLGFSNSSITNVSSRSVYGMLKKVIADLSATQKPIYDWQIKNHIESIDPNFRVEDYNFKTWEGLWQKAQADNLISCKSTGEGLEIGLFNPHKFQEYKSQVVDEEIILFYKALLISPTFDTDRITLSDIALSMRKLSPGFKPHALKGGGFKSIMLEAESRGYVQVFSEPIQGSIQYSVRVLPKFHQDFSDGVAEQMPEKTLVTSQNVLEKSSTKPDMISYTNYLWEYNLYADMATLKSLYDTIDEYVFSTHKDRDVTIKEVFSHCLSSQNNAINEQICRRAFNTILGSNVLFTANNSPITRVYVPSVVEEIELFEDAEDLIKQFIKSQLIPHFGENIDENKLNALFYGKTVASMEKSYVR